MSIWDRFFFKNAVERVEIQGLGVNMVSLGEVGITDAVPRFNGEVTPNVAGDIYVGSPYVNAATRIIADAVSSTPLKIYSKERRSGRKQEMVRGPLFNLLNWINPYMTATEFKSNIASWMVINGDAYIALMPSAEEYKDISPLSLFPMNPQYVSIVPNEETHVSQYKYTINGKTVFFEKDQIIHFKNFNPYNTWFGNSSLNALLSDIKMERFSKKHAANYFAHAASISGVLTVPGDLGDEENRKLQKEFNNQYAGARNAFRVLVLTEGMTFEGLKQYNAENHSTAIMDEALKDHSIVLGVPVSVMTGEGSRQGVLLESERLMWKKTLIPLETLIDETLTKFLAPRDAATVVTIEFDRSNVEALRTEDLDRTKVDVALSGSGLYTPNEIRADRGMPPYTGDLAEWGDTPTPVWNINNPEMPTASLTLPGSQGGRDQSHSGEAQLIDQTGKRNAELFEELRKWALSDAVAVEDAE